VQNIPQTLHFVTVFTPEQFKVRSNLRIIDRMQTLVAADRFNPRAIYDGKKNIFTTQDLGPAVTVRICTFRTRILPLIAPLLCKYHVPLFDKEGSKTIEVSLTLVARISPRYAYVSHFYVFYIDRCPRIADHYTRRLTAKPPIWTTNR
jgi:hypothetical protein